MERYLGGESIRISEKSRVRIKLVGATIFNTVPNIITNVNDSLNFSYNLTNYSIIFPQGIYDINTFNSYVKSWMMNNGIPLVQGYPLFSFNPSYSLQKVVIVSYVGGWAIDFSTSTTRSILGFNPAIITSTFAGQTFIANNIAAFNQHNEFVLHTNICSNSGYLDDNENDKTVKKTDILAVININSGVGQQIIYSPINAPILYVGLDNVQYIKLYWTNEKNESIVINDPWSVQIELSNE
jgi:hypothetical protein